MKEPLHLRALRPEDLPFGDSLCAIAGWNQTPRDWQRFLQMEPEGCFLAEWEGSPVGTATTLRYGSELAWIGMVLVHPEYRRRGIGRALLKHSIAWLQERHVRCIKLDATPAGKQVYDGLGFKSEWTLFRWEHSGARAAKPTRAGLRPWQAADLPAAASLDAAAFGVARERLTASLASQSRLALVFERAPGQVDGYGFMRAGSRATYLGPVVAASDEAGLELVAALLAETAGERVFWDIPEANTAAARWAREQGWIQQRMLTRMYLGENTFPGNPRQQFALAGPEVG
jgi:ribosomal protein S18 acetylase RimI-like enzyme